MLLTAAQLASEFGAKTERMKLFGTEHEIIVRAAPTHIVVASKDHKMADAFIAAHSVVNENGERYWKDEQIEEIANTIAPEVMQLIAIKAMELAKPTPERVEVIKKNLENLLGKPIGELLSRLDSRTLTSSIDS